MQGRAEGRKGGQEGRQGGQEGRSALLFWPSWNTACPKTLRWLTSWDEISFLHHRLAPNMFIIIPVNFQHHRLAPNMFIIIPVNFQQSDLSIEQVIQFLQRL